MVLIKTHSSTNSLNVVIKKSSLDFIMKKLPIVKRATSYIVLWLDDTFID